MTETATILSGIGIGTISASIITFWGNRYLSSLNFTRENQQYLIEKRIKAYNDAEKIIAALDENLLLLDNNNKVVFNGHRLLVRRRDFELHCNKILEMYNNFSYNKLWYTHELSEILTDIFNVLLQISEQLKHSEEASYVLNNNELKTQIDMLIKKALDIYYYDSVNMSKTNIFIRTKTDKSVL